MAPKHSSPIEALGFDTLSGNTHLYRSSSSSPSASPTEPGLVIICSWAFAQEKHIVKYLKWYQQIYPSSRILVVQSNVHNMIWRPESWQAPYYESGVLAVRDYVSSVGSAESRILLHSFSNGGAHTAVQLAQFYQHSSSSARKDSILPLGAIVLDSSPSQPNAALGAKAMVQGLPKGPIWDLIGMPLALATIYLSSLPDRLGIGEFVLWKIWRVLNDASGPFLKDTVPRTYIFSDADEVIEEKDVKLHAQQAMKALEDAGSTHPAEKIRCEEFIGTGHVNHMQKNPDRYWSIVKNTWKAAIP